MSDECLFSDVPLLPHPAYAGLPSPGSDYEAVANYVVRTAERLREQDSLAGRLTVFIRTYPFATNSPQYANEFTIDLP